MPPTKAPEVDWTRWTSIRKQDRGAIQQACHAFFRFHFNPDRERFNPRKRQRRREGVLDEFLTKVVAFGQPDDFIDAATKVTALWGVEAPAEVPAAVSIQYPYSELIVGGEMKLGELKTKALPPAKVGTTTFVHESKTKPKFVLHQDVTGLTGPTPGCLRGTVSWANSEEVAKKDLTEDLAKKLGLELSSLKTSFANGYRHVWWTDSARELRNPFKTKKLCDLRIGTTWTTLTEAPRKRRKRG